MADSAGINYAYQGVPTLRRFNASNAYIRGVLGPFGSGKTSACTVEIPCRGREQRRGVDGIRRTRWTIVRNTYRELEDSTIKSFHQWMPPYQFGTWREQQKTYIIRAFEGCEMEVMFRALDKPEDIKKLLSTDLTGAWVNEAREIPWAIIEALQGRIGRYPPRNNNGGPSWFGMWMDTNAPDVDSKWYKFFEEGDWKKSFKALKDSGEPIFKDMKPEEFVSIFRQPSGRGPDAENLKNLPPAYYQRMMVGKSDEWVKVYVDGEYGYVSDDKAVYPEFKDALHIKNIEPVEGRPIYRGWDFGLTPACIFSQVLPDGRWLVFDELCATNMGVERFANQVLEYCNRSFRGLRPPQFEDYGDPSGIARKDTDEKTCFGILHAKDILIQPAEQDPTLRWESVRKPMRTLNETGDGMQFVLHPRCKTLRKGFLGGYHFKRLVSSGERYSEHAEKNQYSHPHDALQYVATILFGAGLTMNPGSRDDYPGNFQEVLDERGRSAVTGY